ncbi:MAG: cyclic nucleotide-binding domain-containing protein [Pseudomonadota bacterium]
MELDLKRLFSKSEKVRRVAAGDTIFSEGDPGHEMFVIVEGELEVSADGETFARLGPGETVGEMALIDDSPRSATVIAATDARIVPLDEKSFVFMVQETPFFALHMLRILAKRLRARDEQCK